MNNEYFFFFLQTFFVLYQPFICRHLCLFLRIGCSNFCVCQKRAPRQKIGIPTTTLATDPAIPSWVAALDRGHFSYVCFFLVDDNSIF